MDQVTLHEGESQESLLKRFNTMVQRSGVLREAKRKRYFLSKGEAERIKRQKAARRRARLASRSRSRAPA